MRHRLGALVAVAAGLHITLNWLGFDLRISQVATMKALTSSAHLCAGLVIWQMNEYRLTGREDNEIFSFSALGSLFVIWCLMTYAVVVGFSGDDFWHVNDSAFDSAGRGVPSVLTWVFFTLTTWSAILARRHSNLRPGKVVIPINMAICISSLAGYALDVPAMYGSFTFSTGVSPYNALLGLVLSFAASEGAYQSGERHEKTTTYP